MGFKEIETFNVTQDIIKKNIIKKLEDSQTNSDNSKNLSLISKNLSSLTKSSVSNDSEEFECLGNNNYDTYCLNKNEKWKLYKIVFNWIYL